MEVKNRFDKSNMRQIIIDSPKQLVDGLELSKNIRLEGSFKNIIVCGMGGSALPVDILKSLNFQIYLHRDYDLPVIANKDSLLIFISYSGNTEETISALKKAINKKLKIICIASNGKIEELSGKNNIPFIKIPKGLQPRLATGYIFSSLVKALENLGISQNISNQMPKISEELKKINLSLEKEGEKLAKKLSGKIPVIYAPYHSSAISIARIWKIKFNENSKIPAFYNYFPELNHNEMVGYTNAKKDFFVIIFGNLNEHPRTKKRMELTANMLSKKGVKVELINSKDGSLLFKIFSNLLLGEWTSYYLALEYKTDPTPVKMVEEFKKLMQE